MISEWCDWQWRRMGEYDYEGEEGEPEPAAVGEPGADGCRAATFKEERNAILGSCRVDQPKNPAILCGRA
jgi:hypothetical protein